MATNGIPSTTITTTDVAKSREKNKISQCISLNRALFHYPAPSLTMLSAPPHTLSHAPFPTALYTHTHTPTNTASNHHFCLYCMFSWSIKSPSSQVPTHLLNLRQHANLNQRGNVLSNHELICMQTVTFGGLWDPGPRNADTGMSLQCTLIKSIRPSLSKPCTSFRLNVLLFSSMYRIFFMVINLNCQQGLSIQKISLAASLFVFQGTLSHVATGQSNSIISFVRTHR